MGNREHFQHFALKERMPQEPNSRRQAIARALRDNLERLQRASEEMHHASAMSSPLAPAIVLQTPSRLSFSANRCASLNASLDVSLQDSSPSRYSPRKRSPFDAELARLASPSPWKPGAAPAPVRPSPSQPTP